VTGWLRAVLVALAVMVATWALLVLLVRRLPPGLLRDLASIVPDCVTAILRLRRDPRVPRRAKVVVALAGLWLLSPFDLLPEFLPVLGPLDDVLVVALALRRQPGRCPARSWAPPGLVSVGCWSVCSAAERRRPANASETGAGLPADYESPRRCPRDAGLCHPCRSSRMRRPLDALLLCPVAAGGMTERMTGAAPLPSPSA